MTHIDNSIIYLTGFFSTVLFVLCGICYQSNKTLFVWTLFGGIVLGLLAGFLIFQNEIWKSQANLVEAKNQDDIIPNISCTMEYPIKSEGDKVFRNKHNHELVISNNGPVKALSVSGRVELFNYNLINDKITTYTNQGMNNFDHAFHKEELKPFEEMRHPTIGLSGEKILAIYIVRVAYHVGLKMEKFNLESRFFVENKEIKDDSQFRGDARYDHIVRELNDFDRSQFTGTRVNFTAAAEHVWMLEPENYLSAKRADDGKVTIIGLPTDQGESKKDGYAFLELKPDLFKATGFYTKVEIVDNHVELNTVFAVTNTGDALARITEDGFDIVKTIEPGQTKHYTKTVIFSRREGNEKPLEDLIKQLNESEKAFEIEFNIIYQSANDNEKLFKVTVSLFRWQA